jgi:hypothetical protein
MLRFPVCEKSLLGDALHRPSHKLREAAMTFEDWRKEAKQILVDRYYEDPARVDKDHWRQCFDGNYRPWEAARYAAELLQQRAITPVA